MRAVVQRVKRASVSVGGKVEGRIGPGLLAFVGFTHSDDEGKARWLAEKILNLRVFEDGTGKMSRKASEAGGGILLVPQFTLYGDVRKGNRPGFDEAAAPEVAEALYGGMVAHLRRNAGIPVESGVFRADMEVELVNDGPVTILLER